MYVILFTAQLDPRSVTSPCLVKKCDDSGSCLYYCVSSEKIEGTRGPATVLTVSELFYASVSLFVLLGVGESEELWRALRRDAQTTGLAQLSPAGRPPPPLSRRGWRGGLPPLLFKGVLQRNSLVR